MRKSTKSPVHYRFFKTFDIGGRVDKFEVEEIPIRGKYKRKGGKVELGDETRFLLEKEGLTTFRALDELSELTGIPKEKFGYAGLKDKHARTKQWVSAPLTEKQLKMLKRANIKGMNLSKFSAGNRIRRGGLKGNRFRITVKGGKKRSLPDKLTFPNYYGPQRFGKRNVSMGKELLKNRKPLPKRILKLVSHAYQSYIFNQVLQECMDKGLEPEEIPITGFKTKLGRDKVSKIIRKVLKEEGVSLSDFKNPGTVRKAFVETGLSCRQKGRRLVLEFTLPPGSYATVLLSKLKIKR